MEATGLRMRTGPGRALPPANLTATADLNGETAPASTRASAPDAATSLTVTGHGADPADDGPLDLRAQGGLDLALLDPILDAERPAGARPVDARRRASPARWRRRASRGTARLAGGEVQDFAQGVARHRHRRADQADGEHGPHRALRPAAPGRARIGLAGTIGVPTPGMPVDLPVHGQQRRARWRATG